MRVLLLLVAAAVAGCGVDGPPERPVEAKPQPGVTVSGEARMGVQTEL
ncbi:MAG: lipoprotein [Paracoccus sp. (in: a-proteobacteria)]